MTSSPKTAHLTQYLGSIRAYADGNDDALAAAYALGRSAVSAGVGVVDVAAMHQEALALIAGSAIPSGDLAQRLLRAGRFLLECLAPFEMTHRGYSDAIAALRSTNESLERTVAERTAALDRSRSLALQVIESTPVGLLICQAPRGLVVLANDALGRAFSLPAPALLDRPLAEALVTLGFPATAAAAVQHGGPFAGMEVECAPESTAPRTVVVSVAPLEPIGGVRAEPYVLVAIEDVTERRRFEDELRQWQKNETSGRLAGGIAHDFNNLLTVILGYSEVLEAPAVRPEESREAVGEIRGAAERASGLVRQLLEFSRRRAARPERLDLDDVANEMLRMLRRLVRERVTLDFRSGCGEARILADRGQIGQVLMNLVVNAGDAMPDGGNVTITTRILERPASGASAPRRHVELSVSDTGTGMTEEVRAHLFEPFFTTKPPGAGTGLGLATVSSIVGRNGGTIEAESELGRGSTFRVFFPISDDAPAERPAIVPATESTAGSGTVLVVEDEESVRRTVVWQLRANGYDTLEAPDGRSALELVGRHAGTIHAALLDLGLPDTTGRELSLALAPLLPRTRFLFMSGYDADSSAPSADAPPGATVLEKPFAPAALLARLRETLENAGH